MSNQIYCDNYDYHNDDDDEEEEEREEEEDKTYTSATLVVYKMA
jgi:hypothetical protein